MAKNIDRLEEDKALVESKMRRLVDLLGEFNKAVRAFGKKGWMKRALFSYRDPGEAAGAVAARHDARRRAREVHGADGDGDFFSATPAGPGRAPWTARTPRRQS